MDGFSQASLYSLCSAVIQHAVSSTSEAQSLLQSTPQSNEITKQIAALSASFHAASVEVTHLEQALRSATAISVRMQALLTENLTLCNSLAARIHKQMMRLHGENVNMVDACFVATHLAALTAYQGIFHHLSETLSIHQRDAQDSNLDNLSTHELIQRAASASQAAFQIPSILLDDNTHRPKSPDTDMPQDEPPPYAPADPSPSNSQHVPAGPSAAPASSGFSIGRSLKAFAQSFMPKPDPFVNALCQAVTNGDIHQVTGLLSQGINIDGRGEGGNTPLQCAIIANQEDAANVLLSAGANYTSSGGWRQEMPPMFQAAAAGRIGIAKQIMAKGVKATEENTAGQPYLVHVVSSNNLDGVRFLLDHGAKPNSSSISGRPILVQAVRQNNPELVDLLIKYGAKVNTSDITGSSLLAVAAEKEDLRMVQTLLDNGAKVDSTMIYGVTVLVDAITRRRLHLARVLLDNGAKGKKDDVTGQPVIIIVIKDAKINPEDKVDLVRRLLENGACPNAKDTTWDTPALCFALESGIPELVQVLLEYGAKTKFKMSSGEAALMYAVDKGKMAEVRMLLEHGADANVANMQGKTPLMQAVIKQHVELIKLLMEHGADVHAAGNLSIASFAGALRRPDILDLLNPVGPRAEGVLPPDYQASAKS